MSVLIEIIGILSEGYFEPVLNVKNSLLFQELIGLF